MKKTIYVLVGPPSVGKSTWIGQTFGEVKPYIINRDDLAEKVASSYGWTYDDMFMTPPAESKEGDTSEKYGTVVKAPSYMNWPGAPKLVYDRVVEANGKVHELFTEKVSGAKGQDNIVVDMTNMNASSRKGALKAIEGVESDYHKVAVVFNFKGSEDIIKQVSRKRAEEAKKLGKSKTISDDVFDSMFKRYQEVTPEEGFDEVVMKDNTEELKKSLEVTESSSLKYLKSFESFNISEEIGSTPEWTFNKPSKFNKMVGKVKDYFTPQSKKDKETFEKILKIVENPPFEDIVTILRTEKNKITARIRGSYVVVDMNNMTVSVDHEVLDFDDKKLNDVNVQYIYNELVDGDFKKID